MAATSTPSNPAATHKRHLDSDATSSEPLSKKPHIQDDIIFRLVLSHKEIGRVIGKQGARIQQVRAITGATIKILDASIPGEERVIIISSRDDGNGITNAENALLAIARLILKEDDSMTVNTVRLLISGSQAGGLIGSSGKNIESIRANSGATITVLAQNQLPACASAQESDRLVQVSGNISQVLQALLKIGFDLRENPPKTVISIKPGCNYGMPISNLPPHLPSHLPPNLSPHLPPYLPPPPPSVVDHVTFEMLIEEKLIGGLIGKNGYNISKIRRESGANIKVSGAKGEGEQRLIQIGGSASQVSMAKVMVDNYIFSQLWLQKPQ